MAFIKRISFPKVKWPTLTWLIDSALSTIIRMRGIVVILWKKVMNHIKLTALLILLPPILKTGVKIYKRKWVFIYIIFQVITFSAMKIRIVYVLCTQTCAVIGAWKCYLVLTFLEIMTDQPTERPTNRRTGGFIGKVFCVYQLII